MEFGKLGHTWLRKESSAKSGHGNNVRQLLWVAPPKPYQRVVFNSTNLDQKRSSAAEAPWDFREAQMFQ